MEIQPYVLAELEDFSPLSSPLKSSQRIKFTCFDASQNFIVIGATSGGIYVYQRKPCVFLQLIPNTEGAVTRVSISPNENMIAFATVKGIVFLIDHNIGQNTTGSFRKVQVSNDHRGAEVTSFQWNQKSNDLYIGDDKGKITVVSFSFFMAKTIFQAPTFTLMELDSKIVQMDLYDNFLLVSSMTRTYICDTAQEQYRRIGSRPRDGPYGACFQRVYNENNDPVDTSSTPGLINNGDLQNVRIFCARPGARLWEVGIGGDVLSTHKFAEALAVPPSPYISFHPLQASQEKATATGFSKLYPIRDEFLFTYDRQSAYVIDPELAHLVMWSRLEGKEEIIDVRTIGNTAYLWSGSLFAITLLTVEECVLDLYSLGRFKDCMDLCLRHIDYLIGHAQSILPLSGLSVKVQSIPEELTPLLEEITRLVKKAEGRIQPVRRLESGIHVIGEGCDSKLAHKGIRDVRSRIAAVRSRSASPGSSLRKLNSLSNAPAKDVSGKKEDESPSMHKSSIEAPSSSLPDLVDVGTEQNCSLTTTDSKLKVEEKLNENHAPKSVQTQKNSGETLSLKTAEKKLRDKWHEVEDHVKSVSWYVSYKDVQESEVDAEKEFSDQDAVYFENDIIVQSRNRLLLHSKSLPETKPLHPVLDLKPVLDLCKQLSSNEEVDKLLIPSLFQALFLIFDSFISKTKEESLVDIEDASQVSEKSETDVKQINISNPLTFPFRYYFPNDVIDVIVKSFSVLICSDSSNEWLEGKFSHELSDGQVIHPISKRCYSDKELQDDINFCALLDIFKDVIDPLRTLSFLGNSNGPCRYLLWHKLIEMLIAEYGNITNNGLKNLSSSSLPSGLTTAFPMLLIKLRNFAEIDCSKVLQKAPSMLLKEKVPLRHCLYIIIWLCANDNRSNFHSSLLRLLLLSEADFQDKIIQRFAYEAFMDTNRDLRKKVFCRCGFPRFNAQSFSYVQFASVGISLAQKLWKLGRKEDCLKLFWDAGLWRWLLWLLHSMCLVEKSDGSKPFQVVLNSPLRWNSNRQWWDFGVLHLLATLDDKWCLKIWLAEMDEDIWRKFLQLRVAVLDGECLGCKARGYTINSSGVQVSSDFTWTDVGIFMIESIGPEASSQLLLESSALNGSGQLDASFYKLCMRASFASSLLEKNPGSANVMKMFLQRLSRDKKVFSPKVSQIIADSMVKDSASWQSNRGFVPLPPLKDKVSEHHWGCSLTLGNGASCIRCTLPIASQVLISGMSGGLLVFPCGHMIHAVCARTSGLRCPLSCPPLPSLLENVDEAAIQLWE
ncbi:hypothetical protein J437_LFUL003257 [Ladona fulva]|uniref:HPS5-like beta-propeller domain-containing protein n=1 Tax=Ladona fulva TaxID=123851 RepID=A0A8K0JSI5_LADFU|nr:hypothetical protein J437_LFUL003257 [Ladona fulva]